MINSRKFQVWLISLGAILLVYLLYSLLSTTPRIEIDTGPELEDTVADGNVGRLDGEVGKIGDIGIGSVRKAEYIHLNQQKQVDRVLGFEGLLHKMGNEWEVKKPYMNIFRRDLGCYIKADRGEVRFETVAGRPSPKDAKFTGNVVAHILPENSSDVKEGFLYLDDVTFISDKSQFLTPGPVKYTSQNAYMLGNGLEFIYNERLERIEFLRILNLDSVRLKVSQTAFFPTPTEQARMPDDANPSIQTQEPNKIVAPVHSQKDKTSPVANTQAPLQKEAEHYRCVFSKNVVVDSPGQLIFAGEKLSIRDIFRPKDSGRQSEKADPCSTDTIIEPIPDSVSSMQKELEPNTAASPNSPVIAQQIPVDTVVTCDNGFVVTPMDSPQSDTNSVQFGIEYLVGTAAEKLAKLKKTNGRTTFIAQKIDYSASTGDTVAEGPSKLKFYTTDLIRPEANETVVPVTITAQRKAQFLPASNQAVFEGDCACTMLREDAKNRQKYTLSAPQITADLSRNKDKQPSASAAAIEHLTAGGGAVQLDTSKWAGEDLLGFTKLKCRRFDYDATRQLFLAMGPGIIAIDNSKISEPNAVAGRFSLRKRCYAVVRNFDTLKYLLETNQIIAEAGGQGVVVDYFPIVDGKYGRRVTVTAGRVVADLLETADGRTEISALRATGGITYEEKDKEFAGSRLFYDALKAVLTVRGDQSHPCIYNDILVDQIEYDLNTGRVKFQVVGPGAIRRKR